MKHGIHSVFFATVFFLSLFLVAFQQVPSTESLQPFESIFTDDQSPYKVVIPIEEMRPEIPWLPMDKEKIPGVAYLIFNLKSPIFAEKDVRQAFAASIDKQEILELAKHFSVEGPQIATSLTPPKVLGVDLTNQVGIKYDKSEAKRLFDGVGVPESTIKNKVRILAWITGTWEGYRYQMASKVAKMWSDTLGVESTIQTSNDPFAQLEKGDWDVFIMIWGADMVDPENFLVELFVTDRYFNFGKFSSDEYENILLSARDFTDYPPERQRIYIEAEKKLCEDLIPLVPLYFIENYKR